MQHSQISDTLSLISTYKEPGPQQMLRPGFLCARERTFSFSYSFSFKEKLSMMLFMLQVIGYVCKGQFFPFFKLA